MLNVNRVKALVKKDWIEFFRNSSSRLPIIIVPLIFCVVMPLVLGLSFKFIPEDQIMKDQETVQIVKQYQGRLAIPEGFKLGDTFAYAMLVYSFMPMFLIVPIMFSSVTSSYSIVGEKEGRTIEGLLYTPVSNEELFLSKVISSFIPSMAVTLFGFFIYGIIVNSLFWGTVHALTFPTITWIIAVFLLSPILCFAGICVMVMMSAKAKSSIEAQQNSGYLVLPVVLLFVSQISGVALLTPIVMLLITVVLIAGDYVLFKYAYSRLNREKLATMF